MKVWNSKGEKFDGKRPLKSQEQNIQQEIFGDCKLYTFISSGVAAIPQGNLHGSRKIVSSVSTAATITPWRQNEPLGKL